jgi:hypothetical protein
MPRSRSGWSPFGANLFWVAKVLDHVGLIPPPTPESIGDPCKSPVSRCPRPMGYRCWDVWAAILCIWRLPSSGPSRESARCHGPLSRCLDLMGFDLVSPLSVPAFPLLNWLNVWRLLYRAWQVCQTSNEVLVEKLGLDIPPPPEVTLEEITAREIRLAWKQPDFHNSIHKHIIQVNNVKV